MECVTFDIDLTYERMLIAWARYGTDLVIFYSFSIGRNV